MTRAPRICRDQGWYVLERSHKCTDFEPAERTAIRFGTSTSVFTDPIGAAKLWVSDPVRRSLTRTIELADADTTDASSGVTASANKASGWYVISRVSRPLGSSQILIRPSFDPATAKVPREEMAIARIGPP